MRSPSPAAFSPSPAASAQDAPLAAQVRQLDQKYNQVTVKVLAIENRVRDLEAQGPKQFGETWPADLEHRLGEALDQLNKTLARVDALEAAGVEAPSQPSPRRQGSSSASRKRSSVSEAMQRDIMEALQSAQFSMDRQRASDETLKELQKRQTQSEALLQSLTQAGQDRPFNFDVRNGSRFVGESQLQDLQSQVAKLSDSVVALERAAPSRRRSVEFARGAAQEPDVAEQVQLAVQRIEGETQKRFMDYEKSLKGLQEVISSNGLDNATDDWDEDEEDMVSLPTHTTSLNDKLEKMGKRESLLQTRLNEERTRLEALEKATSEQVGLLQDQMKRLEELFQKSPYMAMMQASDFPKADTGLNGTPSPGATSLGFGSPLGSPARFGGLNGGFMQGQQQQQQWLFMLDYRVLELEKAKDAQAGTLEKQTFQLAELKAKQGSEDGKLQSLESALARVRQDVQAASSSPLAATFAGLFGGSFCNAQAPGHVSRQLPSNSDAPR